MLQLKALELVEAQVRNVRALPVVKAVGWIKVLSHAGAWVDSTVSLPV